MRVRKRWIASSSHLLGLVAALVFAAATGGAADAKGRHALIIGVSEYSKDGGLTRLLAPSNDAAQISAVLSKKGFDFDTVLLRDQDVKDKAAFADRFQQFLSSISPGDEVVFYFSGHGFNVPGTGAGKGNFFLLPNAKTQSAFLQGSPAAGETNEQSKSRYQDWIATVALSEDDIRDAISKRGPRVIVIIADACRSYLTGAKAAGATPLGVVRPKETPRGTFLLYSAREGQVSLDARGGSPSQDPAQPDTSKDGKPDKAAADAKKVNSLFTSVLLRSIETPLLEINYLATQVKLEVRKQASELHQDQVPDFSDDVTATDFYFWEGDSKVDVAARCRTAPAELQELVYGVSNGFIGSKDVERKRNELAPCGLAGAVDKLLGIQKQGGTELSTRIDQKYPAARGTDATSQCDELAASPLDANRVPGTGTVDIQKVALSGLSLGGDKAAAAAAVDRAIDACTKAVTERSRVARLKFNLGRSYYAKAALDPEITRMETLVKASKYIQEAADLGYTAAYNSLAQLYQNNDYYEDVKGEIRRRPNDRERTVELLTRGADLGDVLAQYNLGMAYQNGDLGLDVGKGFKEIRADAFQYLSKAAESGFVPAMIETAIALACGCGIEQDPQRAVQLLEIASSRGSWEAMNLLGEIYERDENTKSDAIIWYARAAEGGDSRAQSSLAGLLTRGDGLPAPQHEAAARYWRLAANAGSRDAQFELANLLRNGEVPFRPDPTAAKPDGGAEEIFELYSTAFARGFPGAGLELARLFRKGFPAGGSDAIPKDPERAISLLWKTMDRVHQADPDSPDANPEFYFQAGFELIKIYDAGEAKRSDGSSLMLQDQIDQLRTEFGDPSRMIYIRVDALGKIECAGHPSLWVAIWDSKGSEPPTEQQFNWFERVNKCKLRPADDKRKDEELGVTKKIRDIVAREFQASLKTNDNGNGSKSKPPKPFTDRMVELVNKRSRYSDNN